MRVALILAIMATPLPVPHQAPALDLRGGGGRSPDRVPTRRSVEGRLRRRKRAPLTRGLNENYNRLLKNVFKGAANAAAAKPGPLKELFDRCVAGGVREETSQAHPRPQAGGGAAAAVEERRSLGS